ncbi:MAG: hypothetical protein QOC55_2798, partial [Thermoleophilaceae bacterium]|nr:hypothetical protein [Thermoleophilaceae bacterium]
MGRSATSGLVSSDRGQRDGFAG